jgi:hypothetical protein
LFIRQKGGKMRKPNSIIIEYLRVFLEKSSKNEKYIKNKQDFTRERKLTFTRLVIFITNMLKKSLSIELEKFYERLEQLGSKVTESCSKSGFSQARKKLKWVFFEDFNKELIKEYYTDNDERVKTWEGFRLIGVDGSTMYLINKDDVRKEFGVQRNQSVEVAMARVMCGYDLLNNLGIRAKIMPIAKDELSTAIEWIENYEEDMLMLYDRGYSDFALIYIHMIKQRNFVIRVPKTFNREVVKFVKSGKKSETIELPITPGAMKKLAELGYKTDKETKVKIRLVRVKIDSGETEVLITSLTDEKKYPTKIFKDLYNKRWKIETYYDRLKNNLQIEVFSGHSAEAIKQDFYAMIFVSNLQAIIIDESNEDLKEQEGTCKYKYQINWNVSLGIMKDEIIEIFLSTKPEEILKKLKEKFLRHLEPIRPGRKFHRKFRTKRTKGKYQTIGNYGRAI